MLKKRKNKTGIDIVMLRVFQTNHKLFSCNFVNPLEQSKGNKLIGLDAVPCKKIGRFSTMSSLTYNGPYLLAGHRLKNPKSRFKKTKLYIIMKIN